MVPRLPTSQCLYTFVTDLETLDESDPLQLGQCSKLRDGLIRKVRAASKINVPYPITLLDQPLQAVVGNVATMA